jgi:hypothetical protein
MNNPTINSLFLNLLASAIWDKPADAQLYESLDADGWKVIANMARRQSVSALIADKVLSLPKESLPPKEQRILFIAQIEQTKALNRKLTHILSELAEEYAAAGFPFVLLKGLSNGINYPDPLLRNPGDLDLWLYRADDYERSKGLISQKGFEIENESRMHYKFKVEDVSIENHRCITFFDHRKYDRRFKRWEKELVEKEDFNFIQIDDGPIVKQLPVEMNAFFIFQHMFRHFVNLGVGVRQFCDWLLFLSKYRGDIDSVSFTALAESYALLYPMQVFARAAIKYLHASESIFPFRMIPDEKYADRVMEDILESGNFGFYRPEKKRPKEKIQSMWFSYKSTIRRSIKFGRLSPEHSSILPYTKLIHRLKIGFK